MARTAADLRAVLQQFLDPVPDLVLGALERGQTELVEPIVDALERERGRADEQAQIVELAQEGVWRIDAEGRTVFANQRMATMLGCTLDELHDRTMYDFTDRAGRAIAADNMERRRAGVSEEHEFAFVRADGSRLWTRLSASPIVDGDGEHAGALALLIDITAEHERVLELDRSRRWAEALARLSHALSSLVGADGDAVLATAAEEIGRVAGQFAIISVIDESGEQVWMRASYHEEPEAAALLRKVATRSYPLSGGPTSRVLATGRPVVLPVVEQDALWALVHPDLIPLVRDNPVRSIAFLPLMVRGRTTGVLCVGRTEEGHPYDAEDVAFLEEVAERAAVAIDNAALYEARHKSEERLRLTQQYAPIGLAIVGIDGEWLEVNPVVCAIMGRTPDELLGTRFQDITHPDDLLEDLDQVEAVLDGKSRVYETEKRYLRPDGSVVWAFLAVALVRDAAGEPQHFISQIVDITERKHAELLTNSLFDTSPDLLCIAAFDGAVLKVSPSWQDQLGWSSAELTTEPFTTFVHPGDRDATRHAFARLVSEPSFVLQVEIRCRTRTGDFRWIQWHATSVPDLAIVVASGRDVTESRRQAEELARSNTDLERFASIAAHDLKSPLAVISGYADLLADEPALRREPLALESASHIKVATTRLHNLVDDLLVYARVGSADARVELVDLGDVAAEVADLLAADIAQRHAIVELEDLPTIPGDRTLLRQLLMNLVSNAIKFVPPDRTPHVLVSGRPAPTGWIVDVVDNGIGIDPVERERVFRMFERLHPIGHYDGTGIGLAICRRVVEHHGGVIWIEPNDDVAPPGTRACVLFPVDPPPPSR